MSVYEQIETFGLIGEDAEFEIPSNDDLQRQAVDAAFDGLCEAFTDSALAADLEPMLWGMVNLYHMRAERITRDCDHPIRCPDVLVSRKPLQYRHIVPFTIR